jgi:hypothetical protein
VNLGHEDANFDLPEGFRVALVSREGLNSNAGAIVLPPNTLMILSEEPE